jgi:methyltransferase-like protein/SAM-dependent methyltransferase
MTVVSFSTVTAETSSYDVVPYGRLAFAQTHPDRLATVARIFGLTPPPVATCRVLELGCASGANLIPMAFNLPDGSFVGVDLSRVQVQSSLATIEALGLRNIQIRHASILDVEPEWGEFDYIICHGVFSWVEPRVQDKILRVAAQNLAPDGVAYVSYNVYPGWHMREMVRHMMRYHAGHFEQPQEQIEQARALLDFLTSAIDPSGPYGQLLGQEVERLKQNSDSYLYHEHLEQTNAPLYFHQFMERAERAGLQYLSEADLGDMLTALMPSATASTLERISPDILHLEQYMDFVRNRLFRQTLLCHSSLRPKRGLSPALLHGLLVSSRALAETMPVDLSAGTTAVFYNGKQRADTSLPASKAAFALLAEMWPCAIAVDELCVTALARARPFLGEVPIGESRRALMGDLFGAVLYGMVRLHTQPPPCTNRPSERPCAHGLAAFLACHGNILINAHHETYELEPFSVEVLKLADGRRTRGDMLDALLAQHASGRLVIEDGGKRIVAPDAARLVLTDRLEKALASLTRSALLVK